MMRRVSRILPLLLLCVASWAHAQFPPELVQWSPLELATRAFDAPYGSKLTANFAQILQKSADAACLKERHLDRNRVEHEARAILVRRGAQLLHTLDRLIDTQRFEAALRIHGGADAKAELQRLRTEPEVRELLARFEPARFARVADHVVEIVDRYALLNRFRLTERVSPLASGNAALLEANPEEAALEDVGRFAVSSTSSALRRWLELDETMVKAREASQRMDEALRLGPSQLMAGLDEDLAALCIERRR
jgi:hypothetical protein